MRKRSDMSKRSTEIRLEWMIAAGLVIEQTKEIYETNIFNFCGRVFHRVRVVDRNSKRAGGCRTPFKTARKQLRSFQQIAKPVARYEPVQRHEHGGPDQWLCKAV